MLKLTKREEQAASYLKLGCTDAEIAEKIHCSQSTVKNYVSIIKKKLKANNRVVAALKLNGVDV
jgi:DNA-binding NarL/FixJ family response regulator